MTDRDALAALIVAQITAQQGYTCTDEDDPLTQVMVDGMYDLTGIADAILAAGWRAPIGEWTDNGAWTRSVMDVPGG